ncbi:hypothetical protein P154DRAFT_525222 [Amniculicola lignicola CBS 123094]|uniref:Uncharacterized protein n=1 Tax=Amniculicola lignicola CBS 123094 TaxID=1392246 RepID=A0A6A5W828_9PLEO|nr:hypothetical protein P154DRAFT_525222 [Amniculicola lignicola CBS 123094]
MSARRNLEPARVRPTTPESRSLTTPGPCSRPRSGSFDDKFSKSTSRSGRRSPPASPQTPSRSSRKRNLAEAPRDTRAITPLNSKLRQSESKFGGGSDTKEDDFPETPKKKQKTRDDNSDLFLMGPSPCPPPRSPTRHRGSRRTFERGLDPKGQSVDVIDLVTPPPPSGKSVECGNTRTPSPTAGFPPSQRQAVAHKAQFNGTVGGLEDPFITGKTTNERSVTSIEMSTSENSAQATITSFTRTLIEEQQNADSNAISVVETSATIPSRPFIDSHSQLDDIRYKDVRTEKPDANGRMRDHRYVQRWRQVWVPDSTIDVPNGGTTCGYLHAHNHPPVHAMSGSSAIGHVSSERLISKGLGIFDELKKTYFKFWGEKDKKPEYHLKHVEIKLICWYFIDRDLTLPVKEKPTNIIEEENADIVYVGVSREVCNNCNRFVTQINKRVGKKHRIQFRAEKKTDDERLTIVNPVTNRATA